MSRSILKLLIMVSLIFAQNNVATTSAAFLEIGPGARSLGMGSAYVSVANDASSLYWNPAGIVNVSRPEVQSFYTPWLVETQYYYNTAVVPLGSYGNLGFSFTAITMDEMIVRTVQDPEPSDYGQKFDAGNISMGIAYAKKLTDRFSFGVSTKIIRENIYNSKASGIAIDLGTLYDTQISGLTMGMSISNYGTKMKMEGRDLLLQTEVDPSLESDPININANFATDAFELPLIFRFGLAYKKSLKNNVTILLAADALHPNDNTESINIGSELSFKDFVFLRSGLANLYQRDRISGLSFGCGIKLKISNSYYHIDYTYMEMGALGNPKKITLTTSF